jgi:hypothetical protein
MKTSKLMTDIGLSLVKENATKTATYGDKLFKSVRLVAGQCLEVTMQDDLVQLWDGKHILGRATAKLFDEISKPDILDHFQATKGKKTVLEPQFEGLTLLSLQEYTVNLLMLSISKDNIMDVYDALPNDKKTLLLSKEDQAKIATKEKSDKLDNARLASLKVNFLTKVKIDADTYRFTVDTANALALHEVIPTLDGVSIELIESLAVYEMTPIGKQLVSSTFKVSFPPLKTK